jgi:mercuric ion binding protein
MKMKLMMLMLMVNLFAFSQDQKSKFIKIEIQTSAECQECKDRVESMLNELKGVKFSELDLETKKVTVKFDSTKISLAYFKQKIAALGYDDD